MGDLNRLPRRQEVFVDERGVGLRLTWHPERELVVLSIWHHDHCTASFRLPVTEAPRLMAMLTATFGDWADTVAAARPEATALPDQAVVNGDFLTGLLGPGQTAGNGRAGGHTNGNGVGHAGGTGNGNGNGNGGSAGVRWPRWVLPWRPPRRPDDN